MQATMIRRKEATEALSVSLPSLDKLLRTGSIRTVKLGRTVLISRASLASFVARGVDGVRRTAGRS
jgi:excisionase family DNA binding protein